MMFATIAYSFVAVSMIISSADVSVRRVRKASVAFSGQGRVDEPDLVRRSRKAPATVSGQGRVDESDLFVRRSRKASATVSGQGRVDEPDLFVRRHRERTEGGAEKTNEPMQADRKEHREVQYDVVGVGHANGAPNLTKNDRSNWMKYVSRRNTVLTTKKGTFRLSSLQHCGTTGFLETNAASTFDPALSVMPELKQTKQSKIAILMSGNVPRPDSDHDLRSHVQSIVDHTLKPLSESVLDLFFCHQPKDDANDHVAQYFVDQMCPAVSNLVEMEHRPLQRIPLHIQFMRLNLCYLGVPDPTAYRFFVRTRPDHRWYGNLMPSTTWAANAVSARLREYRGPDSAKITAAQKSIGHNICWNSGFTESKENSCLMLDDQFFVVPGHLSNIVLNFETHKDPFQTFSACDPGKNRTYWPEGQWTGYLRYHNIRHAILSARFCLMDKKLQSTKLVGQGCGTVAWDATLC